MGDNLLTESGLKAVLAKHKIKDNGLQKALASYEGLRDDAHDECAEGIARVNKLAATFIKSKEVAANDAVKDYLEDLLDAANAEAKAVDKDKAAAAKAAAASAKKAANDKENEDSEDEDEEEEAGDYGERLLTAFKKLKTMNGKPLALVVCDARPLPAIMVAKRISPKHKEELTEITGGSRKFLKIGTCSFANDHYVLALDQSLPGLARKVQKAIRNHTGKKLKFSHGGETAGDDEAPEQEAEEQDASSAKPAAAAAAKSAATPESSVLAQAPQIWGKTLAAVEANVDQLKAAAIKEFGDEDPGIIDEVKEIVARFDEVLHGFDHSLADSLAKAHAAQGAARAGELKNAKKILIDFIARVKSDELIAHIDANPFGVQTNVKQQLSECLKHMAEAIGKSA
jgi:hypothetical protein